MKQAFIIFGKKLYREMMKGRSLEMAKWYAVRVGRIPGIYQTWGECLKQTQKFSGAVYKSFETEAEAVAWLELGQHSQQLTDESVDLTGIVAYTDGSLDREKNLASYGIVFIKDDTDVVFKTNNAYVMTLEDSLANVGSELLGAMEVVRLARLNGWSTIKIGYDYQGISCFATGEWEARQPLTRYYRDYMQQAMKDLTIYFIKIKGHTGHCWNEEADRLANLALGRTV